MVADMVEFSRRMEQDEVGSADQVTRSIQLFRNLIGDYGGRVANITGDGILALFDSAGQALRFAIQIQTEFREQSVWGDGEPIQFRIGLTIGEVTVHESVAYGHCINVAARLQALADPSSILVSGAFRSAIGEVPGTSLRSLGQPHLKNISEPIEVFEVEHSGAKPIRLVGALRESSAGGAGPASDHRGPGAGQSLRRSPQRPSLRGNRGRHHRQPHPIPQPDGDRAALGLPVQSQRPSRPGGPEPPRRALHSRRQSAPGGQAPSDRRRAHRRGLRKRAVVRSFQPRARGIVRSAGRDRRRRRCAALRPASTWRSGVRNRRIRATCAPTGWWCGAIT